MSSLVQAAQGITWCFGTISVLCIAGFFLFRHRTVFAVRCPEVVLGCMIAKFLSFAFTAWMFLDPTCPCWAATVVFWMDWQANYLLILRKFVLLFRFEIQAALEKSKQQALTWDLNNVYIKYRHILKRGHQFGMMFGLLCFVGLGHTMLLIKYSSDATLPCLEDTLKENPLFLWTVIVSWVHFPILLLLSGFSTWRLRSHPQDNWKLGLEGAMTTLWNITYAVIFLALCFGQGKNEHVLFFMLVTDPVIGLLNFLLPFRVWKQSMTQISKQELRSLAPLSRLLQEPVFLTAFDKFLKTEFSSENLYFWLEVDKMKRKYAPLLPVGTERTTASSDSRSSVKATTVEEMEDRQLLLDAANDLIALGRQCVGDDAPWQVNISGTAEQELAAWVGRLSAKMKTEDKEKEYNLRPLLEETFRALIVSQAEIYECLRRDPYPRFLLTPGCEALNKDDRLKRLLAAEKLEGETITTDSPPKGPRSLGDSRSSHSRSESSGAELGSDGRQARTHSTPKQSRRGRKSGGDKEHCLGKPSPKPLFEMSLPAPNPAWNKHVKHLTEAAKLETASLEEPRGSMISGSTGSEGGSIEPRGSEPLVPSRTAQTREIEMRSSAEVVLDIEPVELERNSTAPAPEEAVSSSTS